MKRSNPVLVYKDTNNCLYCRIGIAGTSNTCHDICGILIKKYSHICCGVDHVWKRITIWILRLIPRLKTWVFTGV